jgi:hypothetical protein
VSGLFDLFSAAQTLNLAEVAQRTATGQGTGIDVRGLKGVGIVTLDAQAGTGTTPTCTVSVQDSEDGATGWSNIAGMTFVQVAGVARFESLPLDIDSIRGWIRARWVIGGTTPGFFFSVNGVFRRF